MARVASIEQLQRTLRPVLKRYQVRKAFAVRTESENNNWSVYVVGNFRAQIPALKSEVYSVVEDINLNQIESEIMVDSQILQNGVLLYEN